LFTRRIKIGIFFWDFNGKTQKKNNLLRHTKVYWSTQNSCGGGGGSGLTGLGCGGGGSGSLTGLGCGDGGF
jgi:hypothetical protein